MLNFLKKSHIFYIVEDDASLRTLLKKQVQKKYNATIYTFENVDSMLKNIEKVKPDIILSDLKMPGKSGLSITNFLSKKDWGIPVVYITALSDIAEIADKYTIIGKPINFEKLFQIIDYKLPA